MAHEGTLYLIGHFQSRATLEPTLHQVKVSTMVNLGSLELRLLDLSLKLRSNSGMKEKCSWMHTYLKHRICTFKSAFKEKENVIQL